MEKLHTFLTKIGFHEGVPVIAIFLAMFGLASFAGHAYLQYKHNGDYVYAIILAIGIVVLVAALVPAWVRHKRFQNALK